MPAAIIVGGQFGSEGKGKIARWYAQKHNVSMVVRIGGSNAGHTVTGKDGKPVVFRVLPSPAIDGQIVSVLAAGSYIDLDCFHQETAIPGVDRSKIIIHPYAMIISEKDREAESDLCDRISSTGSGTGAAVSRRVMRSPDVILAKDESSLKEYVSEKAIHALNREVEAGREVLVEGTQGFGLSLLHSGFYPKVTGRDTTASGFAMEAGLSPHDIGNIIMVLRTYPIRVAGNSGDLMGETSWEHVTDYAGSSTPIREYTSVTRKLRRVGKFDPEIVRHAIEKNRPDMIVMNHLDYIPVTAQESFLNKVEQSIGASIDWIGTGPGADSIYPRKLMQI